MFGLTDPSNRPKRKKKTRTNLEFAFDDLDAPAPASNQEAEEPIAATWTEPVAAQQAAAAPTPEPEVTEPVTPISKTPTTNQSPVAESIGKEKEPMDPTSNTRSSRPRPIAKDNIKRQKREQASISSLIHGVGLAFTCSILIVAALASLGGYVLYKQLSDQSASLAMLEQNTKQRFFEMETDLIKRDTELAKNLEQTNLRLMNMTASFEEFRSQSMEMLADMRSTNQALAKQLNQARQENAEQRMKLARLETTVRLRR
ncbi:MAG: hypothetical protein KTR33_01130 [Gammaproteobacteria bacterium]|nr:hypothetical protein [Gammaproteobacteria bacterium]